MTAPQPLTIKVKLDADTLGAAREVLKAQIERAQRIAMGAARELESENVKDPRTPALAIAKALAQAGRLAELADELARGWIAAGGEPPADVAADLAEEATKVTRAPARTRRQVLDATQAELDKVNEAPAGELGLDPAVVPAAEAGSGVVPGEPITAPDVEAALAAIADETEPVPE